MATFEERLNAQFGDQLRSPIRAASAGGLERKLYIVWVIGALLVGALIATVFDPPISQGMVLGLSGGLGLAYVTSRDHRRMLNSDAQPGGGAVVFAVTDTDVVVLERSLWTLRTFGVLAEVPIDEFEAIELPDRIRSQPVTFMLSGGRTWRYVIPNISPILDALPERLRPAA